MTVVLFFCLPLFGFVGAYAGWKLHSLRSIDYRERWETAQKVIEGDPDLAQQHTLLVDNAKLKRENEEYAQQVRAAAPKTKEIEQLLSLPPEMRLEMEKERLKEGYEPIDPLTDLPPNVYLWMKKRRLREGWDD